MKQIPFKNSIFLFVAACIWGVAFVAQSVAAGFVEPFTFNAVRCTLGGFILIPVLFFFHKQEKTDIGQSAPLFHKKTLIGGILCGICLFIGSSLQQFGIEITSAGKAGFVTALYIVLVPLAGLFFHKKTGFLTWCSVILAVIGLYLLCITNGFSITKGDFYLLLCAIGFTAHILVVDYFVQDANGVVLSMIQFFVCGILSTLFMFLFETPKLPLILDAKVPILYAGIMSCGVAYTFQILGQKNMNPTVATLILSLESVVSVLAGFVILNQKLTLRELTGCVFMFIAVALTALPKPDFHA